MANTEHISELQDAKSHLEGSSKAANKGCVTKCVGSAFKKHHGSYRKNGYDEHKDNPAKSTQYAPLADRIAKHRPVLEQQLGAKKGIKRKPKLPVGNKGLWNFTGKNFKSANTPFPHMYHHMVPWEVMSETFTVKELKLFQRSGYNLNEGINLIILPCSVRMGALIGMYSHPNDHPTFCEAAPESGTLPRLTFNNRRPQAILSFRPSPPLPRGLKGHRLLRAT